MPFWRHGFLPEPVTSARVFWHEYPDEHQLHKQQQPGEPALVEITTEGSFGNSQRALRVFNTNSIAISLRLHSWFNDQVAPVAPGTAPLTSSRLRSASTLLRQGSERLHVRYPSDLPFSAFEHFARSLVLTDRTRNAVSKELP